MVTMVRGIDYYDAGSAKEACEVMEEICRHTSLTPAEVPYAVGFRHLSVKETVDAYAAFKRLAGCEVVEFTPFGKERLWKEVA